MQRRTYLRLAAAGALSTTALANVARAQFDGRAVRIFVGSAAGGPADVQARGLADAIRRSGGSTVVVDNRPGAGGRIAVQAVKGLQPNGTGFLLVPGWVLTLAPQTDRSPTYDPLTDLVAVGGYCVQEYALVAGPAAHGKTLGEYVSWLKANPGLGQCASAGVGSMGHLVASMLARSAGITLQDVPYRGAAPALQDVQAGHAPAYIGGLGDMIRMHREGTARVLATSGPRRSRFLPDVPTFEEAGFKGVRAVDWTGLFAPANTAPAVVERYAKYLEAAVKDQEFSNLLHRVGVEPFFHSPADMTARMKHDLEVMREHVKVFNLKGTT